MASPVSTTRNTTPQNPSTAQSNTDPSPPLSVPTVFFDLECNRPTIHERAKLTGPEPLIIIPRDHLEIEIQEEEFPPDDIRAMSPRRNSADVERLVREARQALTEYETEPPLRTLLTRYYTLIMSYS
jgi:short coiled-coil protein